MTLAVKPFPKQQILDSSKLKDFADANSKFDKNGRKYRITGFFYVLPIFTNFYASKRFVKIRRVNNYSVKP